MSDSLQQATRATLRAIRDKEQPATAHWGVFVWSDEEDGSRHTIAVNDPEAFASSQPERFADYLRSSRVLSEHWELRKLLPKKLRDTLPEICPALAVAAAIKERGYYYHGSPSGLLPEDEVTAKSTQ